MGPVVGRTGKGQDTPPVSSDNLDSPASPHSADCPTTMPVVACGLASITVGIRLGLHLCESRTLFIGEIGNNLLSQTIDEESVIFQWLSHCTHRFNVVAFKGTFIKKWRKVLDSLYKRTIIIRFKVTCSSHPVASLCNRLHILGSCMCSVTSLCKRPTSYTHCS